MKQRLFLLAMGTIGLVAAAPAPDPAELFGARPTALDISLSPQGQAVAFIAPMTGGATGLYVAQATAGEPPKLALAANDGSGRLTRCFWDTEQRLICRFSASVSSGGQIFEATRLVALDADGRNMKLLSGAQKGAAPLDGGYVIHTLPGVPGEVLLGRYHLPQRAGDIRQGLGIDRVNIDTLATSTVEPPRADANDYLSDEQGNIRVMGRSELAGRQVTGGTNYFFRRKGSRKWEPLGSFHFLEARGFKPVRVDSSTDAAYGFELHQGRYALFSVALDGSMRKTFLYAHPEADLGDLVEAGAANRPVGAILETAKQESVYTDPAFEALAGSLARALPGRPGIRIVDSSTDGSKLLLWAGKVDDPGRYYLYDRSGNRLNELMAARPKLDGVRLAPVRTVSYRAADGAQVKADLTLPAAGAGRGLPAIVMPHGGANERDEGGFDWTAQYFASRGYAVLRPDHRSAARYGQTWFRKGEWAGWRRAVDDVNDAGRWLIAEGIADPAKLAVFGWSFGGFVALHAGAADPAVFKAAIAVAPMTASGVGEEDRAARRLSREYRGEGADRDGRYPIQHVKRLAVPLLLFHGERDETMPVQHSRLMHTRLKEAGRRSELVTYPQLGHLLEDDVARSDLLRRSDAFLRSAFGAD